MVCLAVFFCVALSFASLWATGTEARSASTEEDDKLHTYPYGSHVNRTIEYRSNFRGGADGGSYGLAEDMDNYWRLRFQAVNMDFNPDMPTMLRWLPPLDNDEWSERVVDSNDDLTMVVNRNGKFLYTRLSNGDEFWPPVCERLTRELQRLRELRGEPANRLRPMEVMAKHYGKSLPDASNRNATIWTYVHLYVPEIGDSVDSVFRKDCARWLGETAGRGIMTGMVPGQNFVEWVGGKGPSVGGNSSSPHLPPKLIKGTAGGMRAVKAEDGSVFALWIRPSFQL
ncbi:MAG: hypothetical protein M1832_000936 [Thelocarpon impressellum]|nr:MAG: hypothetical protein M1832_000936 [Thelocarpon impressellum]